LDAIFSFLEQNEQIKNYQPTPQDGKFGTDFVYMLQHHLPPTFLQKMFLLTMFFPGSTDGKMSFFNSLPAFSFAPILIVLIILAVIIIGYCLIKIFGKRWLVKKEPLTYLELIFPSSTAKSAYATEELFTLFHTLAGQRSFVQRFFNHKKQYSLEIVASRENGIKYILAAGSDDAQIIKRSLLSYLPGLRINEIDDYLPEDFIIKNKQYFKDDKTGVIEVKLSNNFMLPLKKRQALDEHDPIAYLTGNMTKLEPNELIVLQVVTTPVTQSGHGRIIKRMNSIRQRIYTNQPLSAELSKSPAEVAIALPKEIISWLASGLLSFLLFLGRLAVEMSDPKSPHEPIFAREPIKNPREEILNPYELELQTEVKQKIDAPMFETSVRLLVGAKSAGEYNLRVSGFMASFGQLASTYQSLVLKGKNLIPFLKPVSMTFAVREVSPSGNPILSVSELTDIYHFPYGETTRTEDMVKSKSQPLPAPLSFKQESTHFDNVFAKNSYGGTETVIGQTLAERRHHTYILGATGSGKTTLLSDMIYNDIVNGKGVAVLDPHGQLVENILRVIPKSRINDVVWFAPDDDSYPIALNLMELPNDGSLTGSQLQKQKSLVASSIISIIQKFYDAKYFGPRMEYVLRNTVLTALETEEPTMKTILDLLTNKSFRKGVVKNLQNKVLKDYWNNEFEKLGSMQKNTVISPITNKIGGLLSSPINYNILTQPKSKIDFDDIMNNGKILLCDLSKGKIGEDESSFFGSLVIAKIQLAALRRALIPETDRRDFCLYVDEFQNFATQTFSELVSEARKYRLSTVLAHQSISQIPDRDIIKVILANVGTVICFKTANPEDEQFILPIFSPEVNKHEIANLSLYNFYMKISVGTAQDAFLAEADNFTVIGSDKTAMAVIDESRQRYATPIENRAQTGNDKENNLRHLRQNPAEKASHSAETSETENTQFTDQKPDNFSPYPLQERSKVGNGNSKNIKQTITSKSPTKNIQITPQEQQILFFLYHFRFLDRTQIQQFLNQKNHKRIIIRLNNLNDQKFIKTVNNNAKTKTYHLATNSIGYLSGLDGYDKASLQKLYYEDERSADFADRSRLLATIYLDLQKQSSVKEKYTMAVQSDYPTHRFVELLNDLLPHAYIERKKSGKTKSYFLEILADLPVLRLRQRLKKYLYFYQENDWESETGKDFPTVMIVCPNDKVFEYVKSYTKAKIAQLDESDLKICLTIIDKVKELGLTGDIWEEV
jgi:hypothetical protein